MKLLLVLCLFSFVALSMAHTNLHPRGCIYIMGRCARDCEEGTHAYTTGCRGKMPEATCDQPNPVQERHPLCDFSACYCDPPTVRDTTTDTCVPLEKCPNKVVQIENTSEGHEQESHAILL